MRATLVAILAALITLTVPPALAAGQSVDVQISVHLRSDYRFGYDFVDRSDPSCPSTIKASTQVVADMVTVRPARFRITRTRSRGRTIYLMQKRLGGGQRGTRSIDMRVDMTRSTQGGDDNACAGYYAYPSNNCGKRSWALDGEPHVGAGEFHVGLDVPVFPSLEQMMADDEWRRGGCGYDSTGADTYITNTRNEQGQLTPSYTAPLAIRRLFRRGRRTLRLRDSHSFSAGKPNQFGGGYTEVRTVEATIRKLR